MPHDNEAPEVIHARECLQMWRNLVTEGGVPRYTIVPGAALNTVVTYTDSVLRTTPAEPAPGAGGGIMPIAHAIADGFTDGNEQFDAATSDQQARYLSAALAVHISGTFPKPTTSLPAGREAIAREALVGPWRMDHDGLERWRSIAEQTHGQDMMGINANSVRRLIYTIDYLLAIGPSVAGSEPHPGFTISGTTEAVKFPPSEKGETK